jgi:dephospho-CoA kinase
MLVVGLTGGISSGKTTVSKMIEQEGIPVICADELARKVVEPGSPGLDEIRRRFGDEVVDSQGRLDRAAMARLVFADSSLRKTLELIIHPRVEEERDRRIQQLARQGHAVAVVDVPLLFEAGWQDAFDLIVVVYVPREIQERRLIARDGISTEEARARLDAQMPIERKRDLADRSIDNSESMDKTRRQLERILQDVRKMAARNKCLTN